ncbi:lytic transglycosylase domain-containing protein [Dendrosporobacter sp. 1207_IL3150]|uniref:lytic transglycosylase domain-containing protein n=1 Tax=Dendrosporobacter sp. 1207_IL3150 TaxID=3084054 RepID=UPI002FDA464E
MRRRWLSIWYVLIIALFLEAAAFWVTGFVASSYRNMVWEKFNTGVKEMRDVDAKTPYADLINRFARQAGISPEIAAGVIQAESSFQPRALSASGAYGLMQVIPGTWRHVNKDLKICSNLHIGECTKDCYFNPELNIRIGTAYLGQLNKQFSGDMVLAIAAYNAGPNAVKQYGGVPPYDETTVYVKRVINYWYKIASKTVPDYITYAERWDVVQSVLGWLFTTTASLAIYVCYRLYRVSRSWRWR